MRGLFYILLILSFENLFSQADQVWMTPNLGQWDDKIDYKIKLNGGDFYIEKDAFTFSFNDFSKLSHNHGNDLHNDNIHFHAVKFSFLNASRSTIKQEFYSSTFYENFFLGNNSEKWKGNVYSFQKVLYSNYYPGIDLELEGKESSFKYSFIVKPTVNFNIIQIKIDGANEVKIDKKGNLIIKHSLGEIFESKPVAWTINSSGKKTDVNANFYWNESEKILSYKIGKYNLSETLIIDPQITFSSYTGSSSDNWGFTAAPDLNGNLYAGGIVFGSGYPITTGVFSSSYNGGNVDVGISKFNTTGTQLIYSTYLGGTNSETPHSVITNSNGELYVLGATSSSNFPMSGNSFDNSFNGGSSFSENSISFGQGSDIFIARFNASGTALLSSTFLGGLANDGINRNNFLLYNYGDQFRGEIILDANSNVYISSTTNSSDFPIVNGFQTSIGGGQDAVIVKMNNTLSTILWSTYYGGAGSETGNSLQLGLNDVLYVTGGTTSSSLNMIGSYQPGYGGGNSDGYLLALNSNTGSFVKATYIGAALYDQSYFVQTDLSGKVYVFGQSLGGMSITPGCYGNASGGQFIRKFSADLSVLEWETRIGSTSASRLISPTAFLVSDCYQIYLSGWGGTVNHNAQATQSSTSGYAVTSDAFQNVTNGNNFYIAVLDQDASNLKYATFMGGMGSSSNHVDGGTSRFDKSGRIYHAVCGGCQGNSNGFTTTPGVWAQNHPSPNCNLAAFKFELNITTASIGNVDPIVCIPNPIVFNNNSSNSDTFFWNFGDGTTSTAINPTHYYQTPGNYTISLIATHSSGCFTPDTVYFDVEILSYTPTISPPGSPLCPGDKFQLEVSDGSSYIWSPANLLDNDTIYNPVATVTETTIFSVIVSDDCGIDTLYVTVPVYNDQITSTNDTTVCIGNSIQLFSSGGTDYTWTPNTYLNNPSIINPISTPENNIVYFVETISPNGCLLKDSVKIDVYYDPPVPVISDTINLCYGTSKQVIISGAQSYLWTPNIGVTPNNSNVVVLSSLTDQKYIVEFTNICGTVIDSTYVKIRDVDISSSDDVTICFGENTILSADGALSYEWFGSALETPFSLEQNTLVSPNTTTQYVVIGTDVYGCKDTSSVTVFLYPIPHVNTISNVYAFYGDVVQLSANANQVGSFSWFPNEYISCTNCPNPIVNPDREYFYIVTFTDKNGCIDTAKVNVHYDAVIYVPNTFTPNETGNNDFFFAKGGNVKTFKMLIFNRWGEIIKQLDSLNDSWDGTYNGLICPDGTYVWQIIYEDFNGKKDVLTGHVNLLR